MFFNFSLGNWCGECDVVLCVAGAALPVGYGQPVSVEAGVENRLLLSDGDCVRLFRTELPGGPVLQFRAVQFRPFLDGDSAELSTGSPGRQPVSNSSFLRCCSLYTLSQSPDS